MTSYRETNGIHSRFQLNPLFIPTFANLYHLKDAVPHTTHLSLGFNASFCYI